MPISAQQKHDLQQEIVQVKDSPTFMSKFSQFITDLSFFIQTQTS